MLEAEQLECVRGEQCLFQKVGFRLEKGGLLRVRGKNGVGKTSLLRMICGFVPPAFGEIRWKGESISRQAGDFRGDLCYIGHLNAIKEELTPFENLRAISCLSKGVFTGDMALLALKQVGLEKREHLACRYLSQGQKRRVAIARLMLEDRPLWVLDEPFVALDANAVTWLAGRIAAHLGNGGLVVMTTHQAVEIPGGLVRELDLGS